MRDRLLSLKAAEIADLARAVAEQCDDPNLLALIDLAGLRGVEGELKKLIFATNGPKPRIVLRDAINNVIEIVEHADACLVYDRPLPTGLTWGEVVEWWSKTSPAAGDDSARTLYARLRASAGSPDGHYASPSRYAEIVAEDRPLRLSGYESTGSGAPNCQPDDPDAEERVRRFFAELFERHRGAPVTPRHVGRIGAYLG